MEDFESSSKSSNRIDNYNEVEDEDDDDNNNEDASANDTDDSSSSTPPMDHIIIPKKKSSSHSIPVTTTTNKPTEEFTSSSSSSSEIPSSVFLRNSRAKITSVMPTNIKSIGHNSHSSLGTTVQQQQTIGGHPVTKLSFPKLATAGSAYPTVTLRETDSIMLTILIAIVIGASILCIILACLVINGM